MEEQNTPSLKWLIMVILALIWGSSFILMKRGLVDFPPDQVASIRMLASFLFLAPFVAGRIKEVRGEQWKYILATGLLGNGIPAFLFAFAQTKVPSFMAGMLNSLTPIFTLAMGYFIFRIQVTGARLVGVLIGLVGAISLILLNSGGNIMHISWHALLIVAATVCYAGSVNILRHKLNDARALTVSGFALCFVGPLTGIYLFTTDFTTRVTASPTAITSLTCVLLLALFGTAISLVIFNRLIKLSGALFASSVTYLIPIVAMVWGATDGEHPGIYHILSLTAILLGVWMINRPAK